MGNWSDDALNATTAKEPRGKWSDDVLDAPASAPSGPPAGYFMNPNTGSMTSRELMEPNIAPSRGGAFRAGYLQGGTLNSFDEILGGAREAMSPGSGEFARERFRAEQNVQQKAHPLFFMGGQAVGALSTLAPVFKGAQTTMGAVARATAGGAAVGSVDAFNSGEDGLTNRVLRIPQGAGFGAAGGVASVPLAKVVSWAGATYGPKLARLFSDNRYLDESGTITPAGLQAIEALGMNPADVSAKFRAEIERNVAAGLEPGQSARTAAMESFGIPAYRANRTGNPVDFAQQEAAARGGLGTGAATRAREALATQDAAMRRAGDDLAASFSGGARGDQFDAAVAVSTRLNNMAEAEKRMAQDLYRKAEAAGIRVDAGLASGVASRIQDRLAREEVYIDPDAFPEARSFVNRLVRRSEAGDAGVSLRMVDGLRKDLNRALTRAQSGTEDFRALSIIKQEYDAWFDDVVESQLFSGNPDGIESLKAARAAFAEYAGKFRGRDAGSKFIRQMMDADASPDDVVRWLFSSGKLGTGRFNSTLASSLKSTLGPDSDEWNLVRQAAFRQITQKPEGMTQWGPQKISQNIGDFLTSPSTRDLSRTLFNNEERKAILQFQQALKAMTPPPGSVNYSGTAYENSRMMQRTLNTLSAMLGFGAGGAGGAVAASAATRGAGSAKNWLAARKVFDAPKRVQPGVRLAPAGATTAQPQGPQE